MVVEVCLARESLGMAAFRPAGCLGAESASLPDAGAFAAATVLYGGCHRPCVTNEET